MNDIEKINPAWYGADKKNALYTQFQVMRFRKNVHYPIATFWTDGELSRINPDLVYFFSPALRRFNKWKVEGSFVLWLDFDKCDVLPTFHIMPSLIILSGSGYHVYWRLSDFLIVDSLGIYLERLVRFYKSDPMARDVTRFMRWVGSRNMKYTPPVLTRVIYQSDVRYTIDQIMAFSYEDK